MKGGQNLSTTRSNTSNGTLNFFLNSSYNREPSSRRRSGSMKCAQSLPFQPRRQRSTPCLCGYRARFAARSPDAANPRPGASERCPARPDGREPSPPDSPRRRWANNRGKGFKAPSKASALPTPADCIPTRRSCVHTARRARGRVTFCRRHEGYA